MYKDAEGCGKTKKKAPKRPEKFKNMEEYHAWMREQGEGA